MVLEYLFGGQWYYSIMTSTIIVSKVTLALVDFDVTPKG